MTREEWGAEGDPSRTGRPGDTVSGPERPPATWSFNREIAGEHASGPRGEQGHFCLEGRMPG